MSRALSITALALSLVALAACGWTAWRQQQAQSPDRVLHARGLIIRDGQGQARVILGAPVPDPTRSEKALGPRAAPLSGVVLLGPDGTERGGYGTLDTGGEAILTLDDASGATEVFKVVANPDRGATLMVKHQNNTGAMLTSWQGAPELLFVDETGRSFYVRPGMPSAP
ncbi:hypothetical protein ABE522_03780 [Stenotrophomonas pennii]|uniref:hypothetical protein n=1 Tax=Stenotrophomonas lacuserhaii TaxID=2760084 RepID=UPI003208FAEE